MELSDHCLPCLLKHVFADTSGSYLWMSVIVVLKRKSACPKPVFKAYITHPTILHSWRKETNTDQSASIKGYVWSDLGLYFLFRLVFANISDSYNVFMVVLVCVVKTKVCQSETCKSKGKAVSQTIRVPKVEEGINLHTTFTIAAMEILNFVITLQLFGLFSTDVFFT